MDTLDFLYRLTMRSLFGAVLGTAIGLLLVGLDVVDNPFWVTSAGIMAAAFLTPLSGRRVQEFRD